MDTGVPLAAVDAVGALAAVEAMTAVRAVHWMQNLHDEFCFFFSFQRCESPTITIGHGELETVGTRVPLAAVDAVGALGALAAVEATTAVRAVHWMQTCTTNPASFSFQRCESPTITIGHGELETVSTRVPLAAVDAVGALGALAAVEAMTAVRAVHWMQNPHDEFCFFFSFQRCESPTITIGHGELETVSTRVPLAAVDAVGALGALAAVEAMTAVRAVHWMQNLHDEFCFFFSFQRSVPWSPGFGVRLKSRRQTAAPALEAVDAVVFHWLQWMQWLHWPQWMQ